MAWQCITSTVVVIALSIKAENVATYDHQDENCRMGGFATICRISEEAFNRPGTLRYTVEDIPVEMCSHLVLGGFFQYTETRELDTGDSDDHLTPQCFDEILERVSALKDKYPHLKILLEIGEVYNGASFARLINSADPRERFVNGVLKWVQRYDFDGVSVFWDAYNATDVTPDAKRDLVLLFKDSIVRMLKDAGVPDQKIVVTMSFAGRLFMLLDKDKHEVLAPTNPDYDKEKVATPPFYKICRSQLLDGWPTVWDSVTASPYTYDDECWVSYDDEASLRTKVDWAILQNLAGVFVWSVDQDDYRADCHGHTYALMRVIHKTTCLGCLPVTPERECKECKQWDVLDCTGQNCSYHPHETECSRYYRCIFGKRVVTCCCGGQIWDIERNTCNDPCKVDREECKPPDCEHQKLTTLLPWSGTRTWGPEK